VSLREIIAAITASIWIKAASAICLGFIIVYSLIPQTERINTGMPGISEHLLAYSGTGLLLGLSFRSNRNPLIAAMSLSLLACLLEFLQHWSPGRHSRLSDALISAAAGALGAGVAWWLRHRAKLDAVDAQGSASHQGVSGDG
jgi:VanZ family protein